MRGHTTEKKDLVDFQNKAIPPPPPPPASFLLLTHSASCSVFTKGRNV